MDGAGAIRRVRGTTEHRFCPAHFTADHAGLYRVNEARSTSILVSNTQAVIPGCLIAQG